MNSVTLEPKLQLCVTFTRLSHQLTHKWTHAKLDFYWDKGRSGLEDWWLISKNTFDFLCRVSAFFYTETYKKTSCFSCSVCSTVYTYSAIITITFRHGNLNILASARGYKRTETASVVCLWRTPWWGILDKELFCTEDQVRPTPTWIIIPTRFSS